MNIWVFQNRDVTKTHGNGEQFWVVVLTKIPRARFRSASKSSEPTAHHFETETLRNHAETESNLGPWSLQRYPRPDLETFQIIEINSFKIIKINSPSLQNRDVTKTLGNRNVLKSIEPQTAHHQNKQ
jgi:hypothetical protein